MHCVPCSRTRRSLLCSLPFSPDSSVELQQEISCHAPVFHRLDTSVFNSSTLMLHVKTIWEGRCPHHSSTSQTQSIVFSPLLPQKHVLDDPVSPSPAATAITHLAKKKKTWGTSGSKAGNPACVTRDAYAGCRPFLSFPFLSFSALSQPDVLICISFAGRALYSVREMKQGRRRRCKMMMQCPAERERRQVHVTWTWPYNNDGLPVRFLLLSVVAASQQARPCPLSPHECPIPCHQ